MRYQTAPSEWMAARSDAPNAHTAGSSTGLARSLTLRHNRCKRHNRSKRQNRSKRHNRAKRLGLRQIRCLFRRLFRFLFRRPLLQRRPLPERQP